MQPGLGSHVVQQQGRSHGFQRSCNIAFFDIVTSSIMSAPSCCENYRQSSDVSHGLFSGFGLDWVWPYLLGYPQEKIAIIKAVCVVHPRRDLQPERKVTMYRSHNPRAEEGPVLAKFGYNPEVNQSRAAGADNAVKGLCEFAHPRGEYQQSTGAFSTAGSAVCTL